MITTLVREEIEIKATTSEEVKEERKRLRKLGYHSSDIIYHSWMDYKWHLTMYSKFKRLTKTKKSYVHS
jgi:D-ribose pyranose/furanose isomerase RbsD